MRRRSTILAALCLAGLLCLSGCIGGSPLPSLETTSPAVPAVTTSSDQNPTPEWSLPTVSPTPSSPPSEPSSPELAPTSEPSSPELAPPIEHSSPELAPTVSPSSLEPSSPPSSSFSSTPTFLEGASRADQDGWVHLVISGPPYQRGLQHGYLLARDIAEALRVQDALLQASDGITLDELCDDAERMYAPMLDEELRQEMQGIADGSTWAGVPLTFRQVLGWNSLIDLSQWLEIGQTGVTLRHHCSAFIATGSYTSDGGIVMGHNTWSDYAGFAAWHVMVDLRPAQGHRLLMQSAPGLIWSGSDYFLTDAGLMGCETTFYHFQRFDETKTPAFLRFRRAMQYADNIDTFVEIMNQDNNGGYANSWLLGDARSGEIARFEQGLDVTRLDRSSDGWFAGYNAALDPGIQEECGGWSADDPSNFSGARKIRWTQLLESNKGKIDIALAEQMLGDHYDTWLEEESPSSRTICGHYELYNAPNGAVDGKVTTSALALQMSTWARWGLPCGTPFFAAQAIAENPQFSWLEDLLTDFPVQPWVLF
jgi:hypothetical protein